MIRNYKRFIRELKEIYKRMEIILFDLKTETTIKVNKIKSLLITLKVYRSSLQRSTISIWERAETDTANRSVCAKNAHTYLQNGNNVIRNTIRLCKRWNAFAGYPLESYLMEKDIINLIYWGNEDTYERFLKTLNSIAGNRAGVRQALDYIQKYKGDY